MHQVLHVKIWHSGLRKLVLFNKTALPSAFCPSIMIIACVACPYQILCPVYEQICTRERYLFPQM